MTEKIVKIGLAGFGTVGSGVAKIILQQADSIAAKTGLRLQLSCVVDKDVDSPRPVKLPDGILTDDINRLLNDKSIEIAVELIGGTEAAKDIQMKMLEAGKDVVTANKALLAEYGDELYKTADKYNRCIAMEASCGGGIPIVSGIRMGLAANNINAIYGILNGTCNYILTNMTDKNKEFGDALNEAQQLGYAEADPTLDINGGDSAHKLVILSSIAFGCEIKLEDISIEGIGNISKDDIRYGGEMGYRLKLLAIGEKNRGNKISLRVHPSFIPKDNPLARVDGSFNAVSLFGDAVGNIIYYGRGAGMMPTASAIVADIVVKISSRSVLGELLLSAGVSDGQLESLYAVLDKRNKIPADVFEKILAEEITDKIVYDNIVEIMDAESIEQLKNTRTVSKKAEQSLDELTKLFELLNVMGISPFCEFDISIVRGLAYYTGVVFEICDRAGLMRAIGGGGRFDNLLKLFGGPKIPATGFGIGDCVLEILLRQKGLLEKHLPEAKLDYFVAVADKQFAEKAIEITARLRRSGLSASFSYKSVSLGKQFKQASACNAAKVIIVGAEIRNNQLTVKDMATGRQDFTEMDKFFAQL